jgi:hypothetical protein
MTETDRSKANRNDVLFWSLALMLFLSFAAFVALRIYTSERAFKEQISATTQILELSPTPPFVLTTTSIGTGRTCTTISQETLWLPGDNAFTLSDSILDSLVVTVDDKVIDRKEVFIGRYNAIVPMIKDGKYVGTYGDWIEVCIYQSNLIRSKHIAGIRFKNTANTVFTYSWVFEVN